MTDIDLEFLYAQYGLYPNAPVGIHMGDVARDLGSRWNYRELALDRLF